MIKKMTCVERLGENTQNALGELKRHIVSQKPGAFKRGAERAKFRLKTFWNSPVWSIFNYPKCNSCGKKLKVYDLKYPDNTVASVWGAYGNWDYYGAVCEGCGDIYVIEHFEGAGI